MNSKVIRVSDAAAAKLERRLLDGQLKPGDRLPAERELAVALGVSRPSLREAIRALVSRGLLITRHGGGTFVTGRLDSSFVDPWRDMLDSHPALQNDLLEFRHMLEGQAARLAADRATDHDIERLDAAWAALDAVYARHDLGACVDTDVRFHLTIADAAHNVLIAHQTASLLRVIHGHISRNLEHLHARRLRWDQLQEQHRAIWLAIREHRADDAEQAAHAHVEFVRQSMADREIETERRKITPQALGK